MKVFGGNGKRDGSSNRDVQTRRAADMDKNYYINDYDEGYNSPENPTRRRLAETPARKAPKSQKPKKKGRGWRIALLVIMIIAAAAFIYWKWTTKPPESNSSDPKAPEASAQAATTARYYTLLVVGIDQLQANTDTIMVVRYDTQENKANIISIPRDTLVNVEQPVKKINAVYSTAVNNDKDGIDALMDAVEDICGFRPNNYVFIDTKVFVQAIDALGGVYFDVPINMNYDDYADNDGDGICEYIFTIHVQKGYQLLDGNNALGVFRFRQNNDKTGYAMGDLDRLETQHALIKAVASQALQLKNLTKLINIAKIVSDNSKTDLTYGNMQWFAQ
ncbi:MAG: LCP family protein, partial [Oscillospiraceae bacterium]